MKYNVLVNVHNPRRGLVEVLLQSVYAKDRKEALRLAKEVCERDEKPIVRLAR